MKTNTWTIWSRSLLLFLFFSLTRSYARIQYTHKYRTHNKIFEGISSKKSRNERKKRREYERKCKQTKKGKHMRENERESERERERLIVRKVRENMIIIQVIKAYTHSTLRYHTTTTTATNVRFVSFVYIFMPISCLCSVYACTFLTHTAHSAHSHSLRTPLFVVLACLYETSNENIFFCPVERAIIRREVQQHDESNKRKRENWKKDNIFQKKFVFLIFFYFEKKNR